MRLQKYEIVRILDKVKSVILKNPAFPAMEGVLVKDGYFTGSNMELTIQVKSEACEGESFILPAKAFDLIKNLPDGEVEIRADKNQIQIRTEKITSRCQSYNPADYTCYASDAGNENEIKLPGEKLMTALGHVEYAADAKGARLVLGGIYFQAEPGALNLVACDGNTVAWDRIDVQGDSDMAVIVPKSAVQKLISLGIIDDVSVAYNKNSVIFRSGEFTVSSRLIEGAYIEFGKFFQDASNTAVMYRRQLLEAMNRAKLCMIDRDNVRHPAIFQFSGAELRIFIEDVTTEYSEVLDLDSIVPSEMRIGFNPNKIIDTLRAFSSEEIRLSYTGPKQPMYISDDKSNLKALVLPVATVKAGTS